MSTSYITISLDSNEDSTDASVSYIILSDSEAGDTTSLAAPAPLSLDYVPASPDYVPASDTETEPFEALTSLDASSSDTETKPFNSRPTYTMNTYHTYLDYPARADSLTPSISTLIGRVSCSCRGRRMTSHHPNTLDDAMVETIHEIQDHIEELLLEQFKSMQHEIGRAYSGVEAALEEIETLQAELGASRERNSILEFCLYDTKTRLEMSKAREIRLGARIRAIEERFRPPGEIQ
ncbi:hypothetical protein Tco_1186238 [Tanacetum coccineum]